MVPSILRPYSATFSMLGVEVDQITVEVVRHGSEFVIRSTYTFRCHQPSVKAIALKLSACPLRPVQYEGSGVDLLAPWARSPDRATLLVVALRPNESWGNAAVTFEWRIPTVAMSGRAQAPACLIVPDLLPSIVRSPKTLVGGKQPLVTIEGASEDGLALGGIIAAPFNPGVKDTKLIQAILVNNAHKQEHDREGARPVLFSPSISASTTTHSRALLADHTAELLERLSATFGIDAWVRPVICTRMEVGRIRTVPYGACITDVPLSLGECIEPHPADLAKYALRLAHIWWGGGCRVVGRYGSELTRGIGLGATFYFIASELDIPIADARLSGKALGWKDRVQDWGAALQGATRPALGLAIAGAIFRWLQTGERAQAALQEVTRRHWGRMIPSSVAIQEISSAGVQLPRILTSYTKSG